jgi:hypothetical protein
MPMQRRCTAASRRYLGFEVPSRRDSYDIELGYDSRGPSPMLSLVSSSSAAPSLQHIPLPMYVPPSNFYGMNANFPHRLSSMPLPIPRIPLRVLPSRHCPLSPVGSIARHTQQQQQHQGFLHPFHNPLDDTTPTTNDFSFNAPHPPPHNTPNKRSPSSNPARTFPPHYYPLDWEECTQPLLTHRVPHWGWDIAVRRRRSLC